MDKIAELIATLFWALSFLIFFGPIVTITSIIGKVKLGLIDIDLSKHSMLVRFSLGVFGFAIWLAIYIPLVSLAFKTVPQLANPPVVETPTSITLQSTETITPTIIASPLPTTIPDAKSIVITEVSGNPCGDDSRNEFIELYNTSDQPINVEGWWITDGDASDEIISWDSRFPTVNIGFMTQTKTAEIPSHGFAVILAAGYPFVQKDFIMPYIFPENTVILTIKNSELLGDETHGIEVSNRDVIVLYQGSETSIEKFISTYGTPILSGLSTAIKDDGKDKIPFDISQNECWSVERIIPINEDIESNWKIITASSPGSGNYP